MSEPMRKRPVKAKSTRRLTIASTGKRKKARNFHVPEDKAKGIISIIKEFEVPANEKSERKEIDKLFSGLIEEYSEPGVMLKGARTKEEMTQKQLAHRLGVPQSHISEMENGKRSIGKKMATRISKILNVSYKIFL